MDSQTMGMIGLGVLFLASVLIAFFSAKSWHWGHVLLVFFIWLAGLGATILAAEALKIRRVYEAQAAEMQDKLTMVLADNQALQHGTFDDKLIASLATEFDKSDGGRFEGNETLEAQLKMVTRSRGRVWRGANPTAPADPKTGAVTVAFAPPAEGAAAQAVDSLTKDMIIYVFEEGPFDPQNPPKYIGEFQVDEVGPGGVTISPLQIHSWNEDQLGRLLRSQRTWAIHETMPIDRHDLFALEALSPEDRAAVLRANLPASSVEDYIRDGGPTSPDDPEAVKRPFSKDGKPLTQAEAAELPPSEVEIRYVRPLRAYDYLFSELASKRVMMLADLAAVTRDTQRMEEMTQSAKANFESRTKEKADAEFDLAGFRRDKEAAHEYMTTIEGQRDAATTMLTTLLQTNSRLAEELTQRQEQILSTLP